MKRIYISLLLAAVLGITCSCIKTIEFNGKETDPYTVIYSMPETDSTLHVLVTHSVFLYGNRSISRQNVTVQNANVTITCNGTTHTPTASAEGEYYFDLVPREGDSLSLSVMVPGYKRGQLTAHTRIPVSPSVAMTQCVRLNNNNKLYNVSLTLDDPGGDRYYRMRVYRTRHVDNVTDVLARSYFYCNDRRLVNSNSTLIDEINEIDEDGSEYAVDELFFSNSMFAGSTIKINLDVAYGYYYRYNYSDDYGDEKHGTKAPEEVVVEITSLSRDLYRYITTVKQTSDDLFGDASFFSEPVQIHCNIENGIGIFGGMTSVRLSNSTILITETASE